MKQAWKKPELDILPINMTAKDFHPPGHGYGHCKGKGKGHGGNNGKGPAHDYFDRQCYS